MSVFRFKRFLALPSTILIISAMGIASFAEAQTTPTYGETQVGDSCAKLSHSTDFDTMVQCTATGTGGTFQKAPLFVGAVTAPPYANTTCDAGKAGMLQWTGTSFQACGGTSWGSFATGGALDDLTDAKTEYASLYNVFLGSGAGNAVTTGYSDTAVGYNSLYSNTTGYANTAVGREALRTNTEGVHNTAIGREALYATTTGQSNTAVGSSAVRSNTTGSGNTGIGSYGLYTNTTGSNNSALGREALYANTTGGSNTAIGSYALRSNTSGSFSTAVGTDALRAQTTGNYNTAVGYYALYATTTGIRNTAIGTNSLDSNTTGSSNTAVGVNSLTANTSAIENTAVGWGALGSNTTGYYNTALGSYALYSSNTTQHNTGIGRYSLLNNIGEANSALGSSSLTSTTTGSYNTAVGTEAGKANVNGSNNVFVGYQVGYGTLTSGSNNILIGTSSAVTTPAAGTNDWLNIGNMIYGNLSTDSLAIGSATITAGTALDLSSKTDSIIVPKGLDATRPASPVTGMVRYNTTSNCLEAYQGGTPAWLCVGAANLGTSTAAASPYRTGEANTGLFSPATGVVSVTTLGTERLRVDANGAVKIGAGAVTAGSILELTAGTGTSYSSMILPKDTTANRPTTPTAGMMRFNTSLNIFEGFNGTDWIPMAPGSGEVGEVKIWPAEVVPSGYLECNGAAVSRTTYAALFAVIGTTYGAGDGSTTFNLPDYRGEFIRGWANGSANDPDAASRTNRGDGTAGDVVGTKQAGQNVSHAHDVNPPSTASNTVADHAHSIDPPSTASNTVANHDHSIDPPSTASNTVANHDHDVDPPATNSGTESANHTHSIDPPSYTTVSGGTHGHTVPVSIYTSDNVAAGGAVRGVHTNSTSTGAGQGAHTHVIDIPAFDSVGDVATHYHATNIALFSTGTAGGHGHTVDIASLASTSTGGHGHTVDIASLASTSTGGHGHTTDIASFASTATGGSETRPRNVSVIYIIRFKEERAASGSIAALTPQTFALSGDTTSSPVSFDGTAPVTMLATVGKIQGRSVASTAPTNGQTLIWSTASSTWVPGASSLSILGSTTTATSPYRSGETNTGLYSPAAGTVGVASAGTEIMRVTASGVGIGTTTPRGTLDVARDLYVGTGGQDTTVNLNSTDFPQCSGNTTVNIGNSTCGSDTTVRMADAIMGSAFFSFGNQVLTQTTFNIGEANPFSPPTLNLGKASNYAILNIGENATSTTTSSLQLGKGSAGGANLGIGAYSTGGSSVLTMGYEATGGATAHIGFNAGGASQLNVGYGTGTSNAVVYIGTGASTGSTILELGAASTANHSSFIDITGDATYSDYGLRIARGSGPNGGAYLSSRGTGDLFLQTAEAGDIGFNTSGSRRVTILATGEVGISNAAPAFKLDVLGDINATRGNGTGVFYFASNTLRYLYYNGTSYVLPSASLVVNGTTYPSDRRLKTDIEPISKDSAMGVINKLEPKKFHWHPDSEQGKVNKNYDFGMIAQDVQKILPEVVVETDSTGPGSADGKKTEPKNLNEKLGKTLAIDYTRLIPWAIAGVQELSKELKAFISEWREESKDLKATVGAQYAEIEKLKKQNEFLEKANKDMNARLKAIEDRLSQKP